LLFGIPAFLDWQKEPTGEIGVYMDMKVEYIGSYGLYDKDGKPIHPDFDGHCKKIFYSLEIQEECFE